MVSKVSINLVLNIFNIYSEIREMIGNKIQSHSVHLSTFKHFQRVELKLVIVVLKYIINELLENIKNVLGKQIHEKDLPKFY